MADEHNPGRGRAERCDITKELNELSVKATESFGGEILGVDLTEGKEGILIHEVNSTTEFKNNVPVAGVDIAGLIVQYMVRKAKQ